MTAISWKRKTTRPAKPNPKNRFCRCLESRAMQTREYPICRCRQKFQLRLQEYLARYTEYLNIPIGRKCIPIYTEYLVSSFREYLATLYLAIILIISSPNIQNILAQFVEKILSTCFKAPFVLLFNFYYHFKSDTGFLKQMHISKHANQHRLYATKIHKFFGQSSRGAPI